MQSKIMSSKYNEFYPKVAHNQKIFQEIIKEIKLEENLDNKLKLAQLAVDLAVSANTGYFANSYLESLYINLAQSISIENYDVPFTPNSFLHVLTTGYPIGGHTRVVERWIKTAPSIQKHDVILLNQTKRNLSALESILSDRKSKCIYFNVTDSLIKKALNLRELGLKYQYVVLHIHMNDPTAIVAFGIEKFTRPILFYNHASHLFWLGKNISDAVLDLIRNDEITTRRRQIRNNSFLGIPTENFVFKTPDKLEVRKKLNLPLEKKIIISAGNENKYTPIGKDSLVDVLLRASNSGTIVYLIGPSLQSPFWKDVYDRSRHSIIPLGSINFNENFLDYLAAADVYIDSYPMNGGVATIDAIVEGTPVLSLRNGVYVLDFFSNTDGLCSNKEELIQKVGRILTENDYSKRLLRLQRELLLGDSAIEWNARLSNLLNNLPSKHQVQNVVNGNEYCVIDDICVINNALTNSQFFKKSNFFKSSLYKLKYLIYKKINYSKSCKYLLKSMLSQ